MRYQQLCIYIDHGKVCRYRTGLPVAAAVGDQVIAKTGQVSVSQKRIQKQLSKVIENYYSSGQLEQEYEGNYHHSGTSGRV